ncbi:MFS transporter [Cryptosporangium sp. NPDC048952]|uniref:MFS transporter n=1 Tax=Cryptosporangium sp. NPDC048952 TaxID=3363961 RepID=UPI0037162B36
MALVLEALGLAATMIAIALPSVLEEFPTTQGGWLTTVYFLVGAIAAPLLGKAADLYGKRRILTIAVLVSAAGALICALAPSFGVLVVGRTLQGVILATLSLIPSLIRDVFPPRQAALGASLVVTGMGAFSVAAPFIIGYLIDHVGFRGLFGFDAAYSLLLAIGIRLTTRESTQRKEARPDVLGGLLLAGGIVALLLYVSQGNNWGWLSGTGIGLIVASVVLLALFFRRTLSVPEPIVKLSLFRRRQLVFVAGCGAIAYAVSACTFQVIPLLALTPRIAGQTYGLGLTTTEYAQIATPQAIVSVACGLLIGFLVSRGRNARVFFTLGLVAWAIGMPLLAFWNDSFYQVVIGAMVVGAGGGLTVAAVPNLVMRATPAGDQGSTAGTVQLCQTGLSSILPVIMFSVFAQHATVTTGGVLYQETGFRTWMVIASVLVLVTLVIGSTVLRERKGRTVEEFSVDERIPAVATVAAGDGGATAVAQEV